MKILKLPINNYYLKSSITFFREKFEKRFDFIEKKKFLFIEISNFLNSCINNTKNTYIFCAGNSIIAKNILSNKIYVKEIDEKYKIKHNDNIFYKDEVSHEEIASCDTIIIADIEHQANPTSNLIKLSQMANDDTKIIVLSKNMIWMMLIKMLKFFFDFSPLKNNFLPSSYLNNLFTICNLEVIRNEKIIALPIKVPFLTNFVNKFFRLPLLNLFCLKNITVLKKVNQDFKKKNNLSVSFIIPCKNEEDNIRLFEKGISLSNRNYEYLFGNDNSTDDTSNEIDKLKKKLNENKIIKYDGPGICKSENVYKGIENASGDIIVVYDADLTVGFEDIEFSLNILKSTNADFINCTRMIYPQKDGAMKFFNFIGNGFFCRVVWHSI